MRQTRRKQKTLKRVTLKKGKAYKIHDNGSRPFTVYVNTAGKFVDIERNREDTTLPVKKISYKHIWIGSDPAVPHSKGNSILLQISEKSYVYIGWNIYSFELLPGDSPVRYYSPISNNDVPYPYLVGKNNTYFMIEYSAVPNDWLDFSRDVYGQFYGNIPGPRGDMASVTKPMKYKIIEKRIEA